MTLDLAIIFAHDTIKTLWRNNKIDHRALKGPLT